jgi:hypothetical protein
LVLTKAGPDLRLKKHLDHEDGEVVFRHACALWLEGYSLYRSDRRRANPQARTIGPNHDASGRHTPRRARI